MGVVGKSRWCVYNEDYRTNNFSEGYNSRVNKKAKQVHLNCWRFSGFPIHENMESNGDLELIAAVNYTVRRNRAFEAINNRVHDAWSALERRETTLVEFLDHVEKVLCRRKEKKPEEDREDIDGVDLDATIEINDDSMASVLADLGHDDDSEVEIDG